MEKKPFLTEAMAQEIIQDVPTPFHVYDEKGIRENARRINKAFSWNKGFKEYFAVKALPNPVILQILKEEGCGVDCSSLTELMLSEGQIQLLFQTADLVAEGGLGAVQFPGGCGKIQGPAHGEKTQQLVVVHPKKAPFCAVEDPSALSIAWWEIVINTFY